MDGQYLKLEFFLDFYRASMMWNKIIFSDQKSKLVKARREAASQGGWVKNQSYKQICLKIQATDEAILQDVLDAMLSRIKMENEEFQRSLMHHMAEPTSLPKIQKVRQDNEECKFQLPEGLEDIFKSESSARCDKIGKKELMEIHKLLHKTSVEHMRELKKLPLDQLQPELNLITSVLSDKLFELEKIEGEDMDAATERIQLESDAEY